MDGAAGEDGDGPGLWQSDRRHAEGCIADLARRCCEWSEDVCGVGRSKVVNEHDGDNVSNKYYLSEHHCIL